MLVLTRRANESILIGDAVAVTVLDERVSSARIGIKAPTNYHITRFAREGDAWRPTTPPPTKPLPPASAPVATTVFSLRTGESVVIAESVRLTIVERRDGKVRIGVEGPPNIAIYRQEIREMIERAAVAPLISVNFCDGDWEVEDIELVLKYLSALSCETTGNGLAVVSGQAMQPQFEEVTP